MYEITITRVFSAAHAIRLYDGSLEPVHGHNWQVMITVAADQIDSMEVVMDFHALERTVDGLIATVNNRNLNDVAPFSDGRGGLKINTTAERVAWWLGVEVQKTLPAHVRLTSASVTEAPGCIATYRP